MPLTVNIGLSRKASKDFQSTGISINVSAELDQALLARPAELQAQIDALYAQAEDALNRQATPPTPARRQVNPNGNGHTSPPPRNDHASRYAHDAHSRRNGHNPGVLTDSQRKAIYAIANRYGLDADTTAQDDFGIPVDQLSVRQASEMIDLLKSQAPAPQNGGGR